MVESLPFQYQKRDFWEFYCPICKNQRRSFYWPSPRRRHYVALAVLGLVITAGGWSWFGVKGSVLILPIWAIFEFIYRARARQSLICPHCGFDPYLYKYDVKLARRKVEKFFEDKEKARESRMQAKAAAAAAKTAEPAPPAASTESQTNGK